MFKRLAKKAFKKSRFGLGATLSLMFKGSIYDTKSFEDALKSAFSSDTHLFGDAKRGNAFRVKTAVVTAGSNGPVTLLSNYNRKISENCE